MAEQGMREVLLSLAQEAAVLLNTDAEGFQPTRRYIAFFDTRRDIRVHGLPSFDLAKAAFSNHPLIEERYGTVAAERLGLQFVYEFVAALDDREFHHATFEKIWERFWTELLNPEWTFVAVANLANFSSDIEQISLDNGAEIRSRSFEHLMPMLGPYGLDRLSEDWQAGTYGSHVLLLERKEKKSPENLIQSNSGHAFETLNRTLLGLRVLKPGDLRVGRIFFARPAAFELLPAAGTSSAGWSGWYPGSMYHLGQTDAPNLRAMIDLLVRFDKAPLDSRRRVAVALRWFSAIYGRELSRAEDRVVDAVTAIEALVGEQQETTFKVAFRSASILAGTDDERALLFTEMRRFYETRSAIVHGNVLSKKASAVIQDTGPLEHIARRLIVAFLHLVDSSDHKPSDALYKNQGLDMRLLHDAQRQALRSAAGLT